MELINVDNLIISDRSKSRNNIIKMGWRMNRGRSSIIDTEKIDGWIDIQALECSVMDLLFQSAGTEANTVLVSWYAAP
jgi:hypothetical protein